MSIKIRKFVILFLILGFSLGSLFHVAMPAAASDVVSYGACSSEVDSEGHEEGEPAPCCAKNHQRNPSNETTPLQDLIFIVANKVYFSTNPDKQSTQVCSSNLFYKKTTEKIIVLRI